MTLLIGFDQFSYNHEKSIYGVPVPGVAFTKIQRIPLERLLPQGDLRSIVSHLYWPVPFIQKSPHGHYLISNRSPDVYHTWNRIPVIRRPWIVTFESYFPRFECSQTHPAHQWAQERILGDDCRAVIALSEMARRTFRREHPDLAARIDHKLHVVYPADPSFRVGELAARRSSSEESFRCLFVGHDFFRKGGSALIHACANLARRKSPIMIHVVSRVEGHDYVTGANDFDITNTQIALSSLPNVRWYKSLPHSAVLDLMDQADLLLFPTLDDTFGYVAMESMSRGTPVLSTNVRALPEINPTSVGWQISVPLGRLRPDHWDGMETEQGSEERRGAVQRITPVLGQAMAGEIQRLAASPSEVRARALLAYRHACTFFAPEVHASHLSQIYTAAVR